jgi:hypothetical protein
VALKLRSMSVMRAAPSTIVAVTHASPQTVGQPT